MNILQKTLLFSLIPLLLISCDKTQKEPMDPELKDAAPLIDRVMANATFTDFEGNSVSLKDYSGKIVLVDFWETWCGPCLQVFPAMDKLLDEYPETFAVIAVNTQMSDTEADASSFIAENDYDFRFVKDTENILQQLRVPGIPFKVFVSPDGKIIKSELGSRGTEGDYEYAKQIIEEYSF